MFSELIHVFSLHTQHLIYGIIYCYLVAVEYLKKINLGYTLNITYYIQRIFFSFI